MPALVPLALVAGLHINQNIAAEAERNIELLRSPAVEQRLRAIKAWERHATIYWSAIQIENGRDSRGVHDKAVSLSTTKGRAVGTALSGCAQADPNPEVRYRATRTMLRLLEPVSSFASGGCGTDRNARIAFHMREGLSRVAQARQTELRQLANDSALQVRFHALQYVLDQRFYETTVLDLARSKNSDERWAAGPLLIRLKSEWSLIQASELFNDPQPRVRHVAVTYLPEHAAVGEVLTKRFKTSGVREKASIVRWISRFAPKDTHPIVRAALEDEAGEVRAAALDAVVYKRSYPNEAELVALANDPTPESKAIAAKYGFKYESVQRILKDSFISGDLPMSVALAPHVLRLGEDDSEVRRRYRDIRAHIQRSYETELSVVLSIGLALQSWPKEDRRPDDPIRWREV